MVYAKPGKQKQLDTISYHLLPRELEELQRKYGRPGEIAPGQPAPKKRKRLDARLSEMDRKEKNLIDIMDDDYEEPIVH